MREMKDSGIEWVGKIPKDWDVDRIKHLYNIQSGATPSSDEENWDGEVAWITPADYKTWDKYVKSGKRNLSDEGLNSCSTKLVPAGSLIFSKRAPIGTVAMAASELCTNQGCLSCVKKKDTWNDYYYYVISAGTEYFELLGSGTTFKEISANTFGDCKLPYPGFQEQRAIADYLDRKCAEIDALTSDIETQIETLEQYKRSVITEAVTKGLNPDAEMKDSGVEWIGEIPKHWEIGKVKFVADFYNGDRGKNYPSGEDLVDEGIPFLTSNNIHGTELDCSSQISKFITDDRYSLLGGAKVQIGDIIYCLRGSVGNCAINHTIESGTVASSLVDIRPTKAFPDFLIFYLNSDANLIQVMEYMNGSCAANLSAENVGNFIFIEPPVEEQHVIASSLDRMCTEIDDIIAVKHMQLDTLSEYKKSVIYEYVTGKKEVPSA